LQGHRQATQGETDGTRRFSASSRSRTLYPGVALVVGHVTEGATTVPRDFENAKLEDICDRRATARQRRVKRMVRGDSAHRVGLVRHPCCLVDWSGRISMWGILLSQDSEFRKLVMFVPVAPQPWVIWEKGWHDEIQLVE